MKLPVRIISCLLLLCFSCNLFAQTPPPLTEVQAKAKQQISQNPWLKTYIISATAAVTVGGSWLAITNLRLQHQKKMLLKNKKELEKALQDYRKELSRAQAREDYLAFERDQALKGLSTRKASQNVAAETAAASAKQTASVERYASFAKTDLSKRMLKENAYQFSHLNDWETRSVLSNIDKIASEKNASTAIMKLDQMAMQAPRITIKQLYIQAQRHIKILAVAVFFSSVFASQDAQAQKRLNRLQKNPLLFLQADQAQLALWEKDETASAICRRVAQAIDQAAGLPINAAEAQAIMQQAAEWEAQKTAAAQ